MRLSYPSLVLVVLLPTLGAGEPMPTVLGGVEASRPRIIAVGTAHEEENNATLTSLAHIFTNLGIYDKLLPSDYESFSTRNKTTFGFGPIRPKAAPD